ncbi:bifunctional glutamate N-acetyltransferase/amino-acid acetyltransferase ArgJ [Moraxella cuniculi]|uniref:Arginine biosynthesis bifunctional protein ArgJ n=1 Tax=Moraxella cuniculi TaxID=34061 RepID=A0A448GXU7_9GAMM|nr:bifunctional glutamate N-acetyltransferase/amino-acid acetyltransferase ArgJ [Moraxella cuniculi]VEG13541.1 Arginine biosynthesis bifunctional protein ArgJ [Moraxella cuniculi]
MAVGDISLPTTIHPISGVRLGVAKAHIRYADRHDLTIIEIDKNAAVAAITTQNQFCAAPVQLLRKHIQQSSPRYLLINTGNANAATGTDGYQRALATCQALAERASVAVSDVLPYSTGVIGETLPSEKIIAHLDMALADLAESHWLQAAHAICTTDTIAKVASERILVGDTVYHFTGISKGAGMIRPNMATMLGFVATDANIAPQLLNTMLKRLADESFNRISIDGDTSTNDCCTLIATAQSGTIINDENHPHYQPIYEALRKVFVRLATLIVRDGEGASKFITVKVTGGADTQQCADVAYSVAHSPLVKTAFFASDPNWGRILAAVGNAGVALQQSRVDVWLDEVAICQRGGLAVGYSEQTGAEVMRRPEITIHINLGQGEATDTVYTCDLSYDYVKINADYRS